MGIDIGKMKCRVAIMDQEGSILNEFTFTNNHEGIESLASRLSMDDRVVMESTGSVWTNLYNHLDEKHIHVVLANPLKTKPLWTRMVSHLHTPTCSGKEDWNGCEAYSYPPWTG
ncbi:MAG: transposase [Candidatus Bathyarchaeia archaeon]